MSKNASDAWADVFAKISAMFVVAGAVFALWAVLTAFLMVGWSWFMVPVFGLPLLSFQEAFGLTILVVVVRLLLLGRNRSATSVRRTS